MNHFKGFVYLFKCQGKYKIGRTDTSVEDRRASMQTGNPFPVEIVSFFESKNPGEDERLLHSRFSELRGLGEWFDLTDQHMNTLDEWFKPSACAPRHTKKHEPDPSPEIAGYSQWIERYKGTDGYETLATDLLKRQLYAWQFVRDFPDLVIECAVNAEDDYTLLVIYSIFFNQDYRGQGMNPFFIESIKLFSLQSSWLSSLCLAVAKHYISSSGVTSVDLWDAWAKAYNETTGDALTGQDLALLVDG